MQSLLMRSSRQKQEAYHKLFNCNIHNGSGTLYGIQRTNGFSLGLDEGKAERYGNFLRFADNPVGSRDYTGVFDTGSRFNHRSATLLHTKPPSRS
jgi:hypothetical protein